VPYPSRCKARARDKLHEHPEEGAAWGCSFACQLRPEPLTFGLLQTSHYSDGPPPRRLMDGAHRHTGLPGAWGGPRRSRTPRADAGLQGHSRHGEVCAQIHLPRHYGTSTCCALEPPSRRPARQHAIRALARSCTNLNQRLEILHSNQEPSSCPTNRSMSSIMRITLAASYSENFPCAAEFPISNHD